MILYFSATGNTKYCAEFLKLDAAFVVVMPDNYVPMFRQKSEEAKQAMLKNADITLNSIVHDINGKTHTFMSGKKLPLIAMFFIRKFFMPSQKKVKGFSVNNECISCGLCVKICRQRKIFESKRETVR